MRELNRKQFLKKTAVLVVGSVFVPKLLRAGSLLRGINPSVIPFDHVPKKIVINENAVIDLHCHPSLKMYLWGKHLWKNHNPGPGTNDIAMQDDIKQLSSGYIKGLVVAHYLVEASAEKDWKLLKGLFPIVKYLFPGFADKFEHEDYSNFTQINSMLDEMESQIHTANQKQQKIQFVMARDFDEFEQALKDGKIPVAHAIEGAHALGRNFPISAKRIEERRKRELTDEQTAMEDTKEKSKWYLQNLEALKKRGVCMITLAHIFKNDIAYPTEGISPDEKNNLQMDWTYSEKYNFPLTDIGKAVTQKMLDIGMIVDLTHCTPAGRKNVFDINAERKKTGKPLRPLVFTHVGAQQIFTDYDTKYNKGIYSDFNAYNVSDTEIDLICECDGVIGVIPENFWLTACDTHIKNGATKQFHDGIRYMVETMKYINSKTRTKDFDHVSIGTDFDGLADAPRDLFVAGQLGKLIQHMADEGINPEQIKKITHKNAERVLRNGWVK